MNDKWPAVRVVHSLGGLRLINGLDENVEIEPLSSERKIARFSIPDYHSLFREINKIRLPIYGLDIFTHIEQIEGGDIPVWVPFTYGPNKPFDYEKATRLWSDISTSARRRKNGHLWDLSSRISHQLRITAWRLKEISNAYKLQLDARLKSKTRIFGDNTHFADGFTWMCYMTIQAFLIDACILRDYFAEYASSYIYRKHIKQKNLKITTFSGLLKKVIKKLDEQDELAMELSNIGGENGWMKKLGDYRDLVVHSTPLSHAEHKLYAIEKLFHLNGGYIPYIVCPIPGDPSKIYKFRSSLESFNDFDSLFDNFIDVLNADFTDDGLTYCHRSLSELARLALRMGATSPVQPEMVTLTEKDIVDLVIHKSDIKGAQN